MRRVLWIALLLLMPALVGCETDDDDVGICESEERDLPYEAGMSVEGDSSLFTVALDSADPAPPDLDENDWILSVSDAAGSPVEGCLLPPPWRALRVLKFESHLGLYFYGGIHGGPL